MKKVLLLSLLLVPQLLMAEDDKDRKGFFEDAYVGVSWGPNFYFWKDRAPESNTTFTYNSRFSNAFGLELVKPVSEKLLMNFGFHYSTISFRRIEYCETCGEVAYTPETIATSKYLSIPVSANFLIVNQRLDVIGIFGIEGSFLKGVNTKRLEYDGSWSKSEATGNFGGFLLGINAGFGFNYNINYHFSWGMNALYRQPLMQITSTPAASVSGAALNTAFYYKF